jgi:hypothetical protein
MGKLKEGCVLQTRDKGKSIRLLAGEFFSTPKTRSLLNFC